MFDFKTLIDSMTDRERKRNKGKTVSSSSPLTISATQLVQQLQQEEYFDAHIEIIKAVTRINADVNIPLNERLTTLLYVDERTYPIHKKICNDHFKPENAKKNFIPCILAYINEFARGYQICLEQFIKTPDIKMAQEIVLASLRGLIHHNQQILWYALRHIKPQANTWQQAYLFYQLLENANVHDKPIEIYSSIPEAQVTAIQVLMHSVYLSIANTSNLQINEILQLNYLLGVNCQQIDLLKLHKQADDLVEPIFMLDLTDDAAPYPYRRGSTKSSCRYWSAQQFAEAMPSLCTTTQAPPPSVYFLNAIPNTASKSWQAFVKKIHSRLTQPELEQREAERTFLAEEVFVSTGFNLIAFKAKQNPTLPNIVEKEEYWVMTNISKTGLGLTCFTKAGEGLHIGDLVLVEFTDSLPILGVVRRLLKHLEGSTNIGLEIIASSPIAITLTDNITKKTHFGLYITHANSKKNKRSLLIPTELATPDRQIQLNTHNQSYNIALKEVVETYNDCSDCDFDTVDKK